MFCRNMYFLRFKISIVFFCQLCDFGGLGYPVVKTQNVFKTLNFRKFHQTDFGGFLAYSLLDHLRLNGDEKNSVAICSMSTIKKS